MKRRRNAGSGSAQPVRMADTNASAKEIVAVHRPSLTQTAGGSTRSKDHRPPAGDKGEAGDS